MSSQHSQLPITLLGPQAALTELQAKGCTLVTKEWVDNAWGLILWKLAGMVGLDPEREKEKEGMRWCWEEVMRQLLYRFVSPILVAQHSLYSNFQI
jgi:breast cancer 2 susceptibility protein